MRDNLSHAEAQSESRVYLMRHSQQVLAQPSMKICLSHALCPMPHAPCPFHTLPITEKDLINGPAIRGSLIMAR